MVDVIVTDAVEIGGGKLSVELVVVEVVVVVVVVVLVVVLGMVVVVE